LPPVPGASYYSAVNIRLANNKVGDMIDTLRCGKI
jgi:hypothetical protein